MRRWAEPSNIWAMCTCMHSIYLRQVLMTCFPCAAATPAASALVIKRDPRLLAERGVQACLQVRGELGEMGGGGAGVLAGERGARGGGGRGELGEVGGRNAGVLADWGWGWRRRGRGEGRGEENWS